MIIVMTIIFSRFPLSSFSVLNFVRHNTPQFASTVVQRESPHYCPYSPGFVYEFLLTIANQSVHFVFHFSRSVPDQFPIPHT